MATSGTVVGNNIIVTGTKYARLRIEWQLAGQNVAGNYSAINWQAYVDFIGCDAQLDNGTVNASVGQVYRNAGRVYNYAGNFANHTVGMGGGSFNIGHDGVGNQNINFNGSIAVYQSGTSSANGTWALPQIPRYTSITHFEAAEITDQKIRFTWGAADHCDYVSWWSAAYDGGGHHDIPVSGSDGFQIILDNLKSETQYDIRVAVRRSSSGLWTESGTIYPVTLKQSNFFEMRVP